ncbi:MAG: Gfo/Idh/MocA family protein [Armatimonadota bacterium]
MRGVFCGRKAENRFYWRWWDSARTRCAFEKRPEVEIVGICDPSKESIARIRDRQGLENVPAFSGYRDMLDRLEMDGVVIASPHTLHFEQIMASLEKGCHVLTEKPMVCTQEHAKAVLL